MNSPQLRVHALIREIEKISNNQTFIDELYREIEKFEETNDPFTLLEKAKEVIRVLESELREDWSSRFKEFFEEFEAIVPESVAVRYKNACQDQNEEKILECLRFFAWDPPTDPILRGLIYDSLYYGDWQGSQLFMSQWMKRYPSEEGILSLFPDEIHEKAAASMLHRLTKNPEEIEDPHLREIATRHYPDIAEIDTHVMGTAVEARVALDQILSHGFPFLDIFYTPSTQEAVGEIIWEYPISHAVFDFEVTSQAVLEDLAYALWDNVCLQSLSFDVDTFTFESAFPLGRALSANITLESLRIKTNETFDVALGAVYWSLASNRGIRNLDISGTEAGMEVFATLFHAICLNERLESLNVSEIELRNLGPQIAQMIETNNTLKRLCMRASEIRSGDMVWIGKAIGESKTIEFLDISDNDIGAEGIEALASGIERNTSIRGLKVGGNPISDRTLVPLVEALKVNRSIESVNMCHSLAGELTAKALADVIKVNRVIKNINLQDNRIEDRDIAVLAEVLSKTGSLESISFKGNLIGFEGAEKIADLLQSGSPIKRLNLRGNPIPAACRSRIISLSDELELFIDQVAA